MKAFTALIFTSAKEIGRRFCFNFQLFVCLSREYHKKLITDVNEVLGECVLEQEIIAKIL